MTIPDPIELQQRWLRAALAEGVAHGDAAHLLDLVPPGSLDLIFTSPPYADQRAYSRIHPDAYVEWFLPFAEQMLAGLTDSGSLVLNVKNRVANRGPYKGQRHPYVFELVLALQRQGWRWIETYIWSKPNAVPGKFGPRTKDSFEYVFHLAKGKPFFDVDAVRVPYRADSDEIARRAKDTNGRRQTEAGFGRDRSRTYGRGGADPGNVVSVSQTYNQHVGVKHTAAMPIGLVEFFVQAMSPPGGIVLDPFAGGGTTMVAARALGRFATGFELHEEHVTECRRRLAQPPGGDVEPRGMLAVG